MTAEEAEMVKKIGGKGPGGCRSKTQCETYCEDNSEECFNFAKEKGMISEDDLAEMREGMDRFREELDKMPPEAVQCMKDAVGEENFNKIANGQPIFDRSMEGKMKSCFGQVTAQFSRDLSNIPPEAAECIKNAVGEEDLRKLQSGEIGEHFDFGSLELCFQQLQQSFGGGSNFGDGGFSGPGGCKNTEECTAYCQANPDKCSGPGKQSGQHVCISPIPELINNVPGCIKYCEENPEECRKAKEAWCRDNPEQCGGDGSGSTGGDLGGFSECGIVTGAVAEYVCAINGRGAPSGVETTYFNECHAKQHGAEILHEGGCKGHAPCSDIADPVCGNDNNSWVSACHAKEKGGGVQYEGVCKGRSGGGGGGFPGAPPGGFPGGPGGCQSQEECQTYCQSHPQECGGGGGTPLPPLPTLSCVPPPSGLVSWWSADLASGATVPDISGGNNGTISGGVAIVPMEVGEAFQFDGSSGRINMGNPGNLNFGTGAFSLEAWLNWDGGGSSVNNIIRKSNFGPDSGSGYWLRIGRDARIIEFSVGATTGPEGQSLMTAPISSGIFRHVVAAKNSAGDMNIYIDGQSKGTYVRQASSAESTSGSTFALGSWADQNSEFFSGLIDDVSVYNRALSASEARALFDAGSIGKCATDFGRTNRELPQDNQPIQPPTSFSGPGGCKNPEECKVYCAKNFQDPECQKFGPSSETKPSNQGFFAGALGTFGPLLGIQ
jgi:hypothetical protein